MSSFSEKVHIRTDANETIASGHVMRSLSVADALAAIGARVDFILSDDNAKQLIEDRGYAVRVLSSDWRNLEDGFEDIERMCLQESEHSIMLVDTYSIDRSFVERASAFSKVCYLGSKKEDLGPLSLLVNYSTIIDEAWYADAYEKRGARLLLGPKYAPLKSCFDREPIEISPTVSKVLVTTGGSDPYSFEVEFVSRALDSLSGKNLRFEIVIGRMSQDRDLLERRFADDDRVALHFNVSNMIEIMKECDLAVSANGTTVYELAAMGIPTISFAMVPEQEESAKRLMELGAVECCGSLYCDPLGVIAHAVSATDRLARDMEHRSRLAKTARGLIDGKGSRRIAKAILDLNA